MRPLRVLQVSFMFALLVTAISATAASAKAPPLFLRSGGLPVNTGEPTAVFVTVTVNGSSCSESEWDGTVTVTG